MHLKICAKVENKSEEALFTVPITKRISGKNVRAWVSMVSRNTCLIIGTIHKGRLLKGVGRWVHQKEIYNIRLFSKNRRQG